MPGSLRTLTRWFLSQTYMEITILPVLGEQEGTHVWGHTDRGWDTQAFWHQRHDAVYISVSVLIQSLPTLCDPMDCSPSGSSVHGIFQARILDWVVISYSRGSPWPRDRTRVSCISCTGRQILYHGATKEANGELEKKQIKKKAFTSRKYLEQISCFKPTQTFFSKRRRSREDEGTKYTQKNVVYLLKYIA